MKPKRIQSYWTSAALCFSLIVVSHIALSETQIYKSTDSNGQFVFSDQKTENSTAQSIREVQTVPSIDTSILNTVSPSDDKEPSARTIYRVFDIMEPKSGAVFHSGSGNVVVSVNLEPTLRGRHQLHVSLNGKLITTTRSTSITLPHVDRGSHVLSISIQNEEGKTLAQKSRSFTLHRPRVARP